MLVTQQGNPRLTPINPLMERWVRLMTGEEGRGRAFGHWVGRTFGTRDLRRLGTSSGEIPWTPLRGPLAEATVALVTTTGVHLRTARPFDLNGDASFRVIPGGAAPDDLQITHQAYDRGDAARDISLVFPLPRVRELAAEGIIGRVADEHYGFGLAPKLEDLLAPGREVGRRLRRAGVDLALLVPA